MHTKTLNRRDFLKKVGMAGAAIAVMPTANAVGMLAKPEEAVKVVNPEWSKDDFYKQVTYMFHYAAKLKEKTLGKFVPPEDSFIVEIPRWIEEDMKSVKNEYGYTTWDFLHLCWPKSRWSLADWPLPDETRCPMVTMLCCCANTGFCVSA